MTFWSLPTPARPPIREDSQKWKCTRPPSLTVSRVELTASRRSNPWLAGVAGGRGPSVGLASAVMERSYPVKASVTARDNWHMMPETIVSHFGFPYEQDPAARNEHNLLTEPVCKTWPTLTQASLAICPGRPSATQTSASFQSCWKPP